MTLDQTEYQIRCEWGIRGLKELAPVSDIVVIIDVLSFTTALDVAISRGRIVLPYPFKDDSAARYAASRNAHLASPDRGTGFSLSPASLQSLPLGCRLVLPSPNGAALSFAVNHGRALAGCLRNASAVGKKAARLGATIAVIPAGERWASGELRPCAEDLIGAGAIISSLSGKRSPEADLAVAAFEKFGARLTETLQTCSSGKELIERGFARDVELAAELDVSNSVPRLVDHAFLNENGEPSWDDSPQLTTAA